MMRFSKTIKVSMELLIVGILITCFAGTICLAADDDAKDSTGTQREVKKVDPEAAGPVRVAIKTSLGDIILDLDKAKAPITVANFLSYAEEGFYDGTIFHRVIGNFMIQGGGFTEDMQQKKTKAGIENEWKNGLSNVNGSISMARLGNQPNSATSQFFINVKDNSFLDQPRDGAGYAVFGQVVEGMDVVDKIKAVKTHTAGRMGDVPVEPVVINSVVLVEKEKAKK
jgi:cyclophilin family peptidyl-prolyl cis-trans isomerase